MSITHELCPRCEKRLNRFNKAKTVYRQYDEPVSRVCNSCWERVLWWDETNEYWMETCGKDFGELWGMEGVYLPKTFISLERNYRSSLKETKGVIRYMNILGDISGKSMQELSLMYEFYSKKLEKIREELNAVAEASFDQAHQALPITDELREAGKRFDDFCTNYILPIVEELNKRQREERDQDAPAPEPEERRYA